MFCLIFFTIFLCKIKFNPPKIKKKRFNYSGTKHTIMNQPANPEKIASHRAQQSETPFTKVPLDEAIKKVHTHQQKSRKSHSKIGPLWPAPILCSLLSKQSLRVGA
jgi:hypothetical protein